MTSSRPLCVVQIKALDENRPDVRQTVYFPEDHAATALNCNVAHVRLSGLRLCRPRQWAHVGWPVSYGTGWDWMISVAA